MLLLLQVVMPSCWCCCASHWLCCCCCRRWCQAAGVAVRVADYVVVVAGGDAKLLMLLCVSPSKRYITESLIMLLLLLQAVMPSCWCCCASRRPSATSPSRCSVSGSDSGRGRSNEGPPNADSRHRRRKWAASLSPVPDPSPARAYRGHSGRKETFYLTTHSTHCIYGYMASDIWLRTILIVREETHCRHMGYSYRLTARVLLYAPSHRQESTYHGLCYTSRGTLAETRNSSMDPPHDGSIRRPIAPWANALTTELHLTPALEILIKTKPVYLMTHWTHQLVYWH